MKEETKEMALQGSTENAASEQGLQAISRFLLDNNYVTPWIMREHINPLFAASASVVSVLKGERLFHQGSVNHSIYILRTGRMRIICIGENGTEYCVYIAEKGAMIGEVSTTDGSPNHVSAYAITNTTLYQLNINDMKRLIGLHPSLSLEIMQSLAYKVRLLNSQIEYSQRSADARIAGALLALGVRYGEQSERGLLISLRFTHEELAGLVKLNRVTVSRILRALANSGVIETQNGFVIRDSKRLMDLIGKTTVKAE